MKRWTVSFSVDEDVIREYYCEDGSPEDVVISPDAIKDWFMDNFTRGLAGMPYEGLRDTFKAEPVDDDSLMAERQVLLDRMRTSDGWRDEATGLTSGGLVTND